MAGYKESWLDIGRTIQFQVSFEALLYQLTICNILLHLIMPIKIIDFSLVILFLILSVKYSSLLPCSNRTNAESQSTNDSNQSLSDNGTTTNQEAFRKIEGCQCRWRDDSESCTSLEEAIYDMYERIDPDEDTPYQFFSLKDLLYSSILAGRESLDGGLQPPPIEADFNSESEMQISRDHCSLLAGRYNFTTRDTESCRWSFNCMQHQNEFPSFYLEAKLDSSSDAGSCAPVTTRNRRFLRTTCQNNATLPHWLDCDCGSLVIGYKYS